MKRRWAIVLAALWVAALLAADAWCLLEFKVAESYLKTALDEVFAAPVSFGELTLSPTFDVIASDIRLMRPDHHDKLYGTIDEIRVTPRWFDLVTKLKLEVKEIAVRNPTLVVKWHEGDGTFDMPSPIREELETKTKEVGELPAIRLRGLTLALENPPDVVKHRQNFRFDTLAVTLAPEGSARWLYRFEVDVEHPILGRMHGWGRFSQDELNLELQRNGIMVTQDLLGAVTPDVKSLLENLLVAGDLRLTARVGPVAGGPGEAFSAAVDCQGMTVHVKGWPQAVTNIRGRLDFSQGKLTTELLTAEFENAPLTMRGTLDLGGGSKVLDASGEIIGLAVSNRLASRIRKLPEPCPTVADQIEAWDPDGFANVKFRLLQERDEKHDVGLLHPFFEVEFKGATVLRYIGHVGDDGERHGFAYPLEDLRGVIRFTDQEAVFDRLTAMNGSLAVEAHGRINYENGGDETYDVDVLARGLRLDERVGAALKGSARDLFNSLDADGLVDLAVAVKRQKPEPPGPRVDITVELQGVGMRTRAFPLELADARGRAIITDSGTVVIEKMTAKRRGGTVVMRGKVPVDSKGGTFDLDLDFEKFPLDPVLTAALKEVAPDAAEALVKLNPTGRIDGAVHLALDENGAQKELRGSIRFEGMTLAPEDPSVRLDDVTGSVTLGLDAISINPNTMVSVAGERFGVRGVVKSGGDLDLWIEAASIRASKALMADVEPLVPSIRRFDTRPEISGPMGLTVHVVGPAHNPDFALDADLRGVDVVVGVVRGLELAEVRGHVAMSLKGEVKATGVTMRIPIPHGAAGASRPSEIVAGATEDTRPAIAFELASGTYEPPAAKAAPAHPRGRLLLTGCSARGVEISPATIAMLPFDAELRAKLADLAILGVADITVGTLKWDGTQVAISKARVAASRLSLGADRAIRADSFAIEHLALTAGNGLLDLKGEFLAQGGRFLDIPVPRASGRLSADVAGIQFEELDADLLGYDPHQTPSGPAAKKQPLGRIYHEKSRLGVSFADGSFDSFLHVQDVNLPAVIRTFGGTPGQIIGTFRSAVTLSGKLGDLGSLKGAGDLNLRAWNVVSLPVFYKMFNSLDLLSLFDSRKDPWTAIAAEFTVGERALHLKPVTIDAPDIQLQGVGSLTFAGVVKADLKTKQEMGVSPIGWITHIISHAVFAGVRIEGPIGDPRVDAYGVGQ